MSKSRDYTLVEMMAVMTVASVLLAIAAEVVTRAMRIDTTWREQAGIARSMSRLSHDLRRDVHQARNVTVTQEPLAMEITRDDGAEVSYTVADEEIIRSSQQDEEQLEREYYKKAADQQVAITTLSSPERVELRVTQEVKLVGEAPRTVLHVLAEVGRFVRLTQSEEVRR